MKKNKLNKLILFATVIMSAASFVGCNTAKEAADKTKAGMNEAKNSVENTTENVKNKTENAIKDFTEEESNFDKKALIKDLEAKGFEPKNAGILKKDSDKVSSVDGELIKIKGGEIRVYEYNKDQKGLFDSDVNMIQENGYKINGNKIDWKNAPHFYRKGRVAVVYDGNSQEIVKSLSEILGSPFIG